MEGIIVNRRKLGPAGHIRTLGKQSLLFLRDMAQSSVISGKFGQITSSVDGVSRCEINPHVMPPMNQPFSHSYMLPFLSDQLSQHLPNRSSRKFSELLELWL